MLDINQIKNSIPQRFPYLMLDRIIEIDEGKKVIGIKNLYVNFWDKKGASAIGSRKIIINNEKE
ncbi:MAG: hypothetical protein HY810_10720 [Candidatus Omnitrophica bacterium]|nr:hypothetical protein [Candidatus Omnitrophota bacterium]